jgi:putative transposase
VNIKRVYRLYKLEGLEVRTKKRRKRASHLRVVPPTPTAPNERWSMDFMRDTFDDGRPFRILTVVDTFTRIRNSRTSSGRSRNPGFSTTRGTSSAVR